MMFFQASPCWRSRSRVGSGNHTMKLYARRSSSNSQKVLWFLGELDMDYEFISTGGDAGGLDSDEFRMLNSNGSVPVLVAGQSTWVT